MQAEIITIGDELLIGQVVDTNSAWMAQQLNAIGIEVKQVTSVHDEATHIQTALQEALTRADIVLLTGGLGPTKDDITKATLCRFFNTALVENTDVRKHIHQLYQNRPDVLNQLTATQWLVPEAAQIIENTVGSAPVMLFHTGTPEHPQTVISMPGVPYEMQYAMEHHLLPLLQEQADMHIVHRTLQVYGIPESALALQIAAWEDALPPYLHLAYLPKDGIIRLRLSGKAYASTTGKHTLEQEMEQQLQALFPLIADHLIATDDLPLEVLLGQILTQKNLTISSAESCTGGKIAALLNRHAGSSAFYKGSVVAYANEVKRNLLGVSDHDLLTCGAVSEPVVRQMAIGVRSSLGTDIAIATSGIAGPDGGTEEKPVGTVWIAVATPHTTITRCLRLGKLREQITDRAATVALIMAIQAVRNMKDL
ncbi:MAG: CinA family nicotinamide mononucleotide deamidase-related protein [Paludibacter sp.]|nr:CinA family nicotinamide mononucleotide deamidase-related protein [Bacteroidales bacterium]MCM1069055.1 CinA family nicotinamide mononucleotide deamidase-related protein [Prevotella sp.]MCM1353494.1 CinA family nicotinamide mononucleotide deamidase-related protein [Bacteroides sp.]MCM1442655.1 CinA family nicotinamide mononucleotide deamidase-related protein [Muribaculum sp.]MCM1481708.1 CinA family nicotinamide mononucleotide deamidase-related protein [Paludibacter sp.]